MQTSINASRMHLRQEMVPDVTRRCGEALYLWASAEAARGSDATRGSPRSAL